MDRNTEKSLEALNFDVVVEQTLDFINATENTSRSYKRTFEDYRLWAERVGVHPLTVDHRQLNRYLSEVLERDWAIRTKAIAFSTLSSLFNYVSVTWRAASPSTHPDIIRIPNRTELGEQLQITSVTKHAQIMEAALQSEGPSDTLQVLLIGVNGLKVSDVCAADVQDVRLGPEPSLKLALRGSESETPLVGPEPQLVEQVLGDRVDGPLFRNRSGRRINRNSLIRTIGRVCREADVQPESPRILRNTAGMIAANEGISTYGLQRMLDIGDRTVVRFMSRSSVDEDSGATRVLRRLQLEPEHNGLLEQAERMAYGRDSHPIAPISLCGAVLEQHLRDLCKRFGVALPRESSIDRLKGLLVGEGVLARRWIPRIEVWRDLRNDASHGHAGLTLDDAQSMIGGVREFLRSDPREDPIRDQA